jgi:hypothetical protein
MHKLHICRAPSNSRERERTERKWRTRAMHGSANHGSILVPNKGVQPPTMAPFWFQRNSRETQWSCTARVRARAPASAPAAAPSPSSAEQLSAMAHRQTDRQTDRHKHRHIHSFAQSPSLSPVPSIIFHSLPRSHKLTPPPTSISPPLYQCSHQPMP